MKYIWMSRKLKSKVHLVGSDERTLCKAENNGAKTIKRLDSYGDQYPKDRTLCGICVHLAGEKRIEGAPKKPKPDSGFYQSWEWQQLRYEVLKKHGPRCMLCGADSRTTKIVVDHIKPRRFYPELELEFSNCQVLCDQCNRGKNYKDQTDFRDLYGELEAGEHMRSIKTEGSA